jgi:hypothetical protein
MMRLSFAPLTAIFLCGCAGQPTERVLSAPKRELAPAERAALATTLSQTLKDPGSAQFKWMPIVLLERDGITDYCGLLNGRNTYGGYVGYQKFYAQLNRNDKGEYIRGQIRITASDEVSIAVANDVCDKFGYTDFSQAR